MIFPFLAMVPILALNSVSTPPKAEVSAILTSAAPPALRRSLHSSIHITPSDHRFHPLGHLRLLLQAIFQLPSLFTIIQNT